MAKYKLSAVDPDTGQEFPTIIMHKDNAGNALAKNLYIPKDNANADYKEYLIWLAEPGNEPDPSS